MPLLPPICGLIAKYWSSEFFRLVVGEGMSDFEELDAILDRAVRLKEIMKATNRINNVAAAVAKHFRENVEPMGFKAFLVAVDREACALYRDGTRQTSTIGVFGGSLFTVPPRPRSHESASPH